VTAVVDTSVLVALIHPEDIHNKGASTLLATAAEEGALVINDIVYSELGANRYFDDPDGLDYFLSDIGVELRDVGRSVAFRAGEQFSEYLDQRGDGLQCPGCGHETTLECPSCGTGLAPRQHIAADFVVGAHAEQEDALLTFDKGFYRDYFDVDVRTIEDD